MATMKIKAKEKDGIVKVKVQIKHKMMTYKQAEKKGIKANFITHIASTVGDKTVYEVSTSQFLSKNPLLKFKFRGKKDDILTITWQDSSGKNVMESKSIK